MARKFQAGAALPRAVAVLLLLLAPGALARDEAAAGRRARGVCKWKDGSYEPVTWDSRLASYRVNVRLTTELFTGGQQIAHWNPGFSYVASGQIYDIGADRSSKTQVGTFQITAITTARKDSVSSYVGTLVARLGGKNGLDDTLTFTGAMDVSNSQLKPIGAALVCTGGSGKFMGAFGQADLVTSADFATSAEGWVTFFVPKVSLDF